MMNETESLRRWLSMCALALAFGMLIWGQMVLQPYLNGVAFDLYWGLCFALSAVSIAMSVLEVRWMLQEVRQQQRTLVRRAMRDIRKGRSRDVDSASLN